LEEGYVTKGIVGITFHDTSISLPDPYKRMAQPMKYYDYNPFIQSFARGGHRAGAYMPSLPNVSSQTIIKHQDRRVISILRINRIFEIFLTFTSTRSVG